MGVLGRNVLCQGKVMWLREDPELACEGCTQFRFAGGALNPPRLRSQSRGVQTGGLGCVQGPGRNLALCGAESLVESVLEVWSRT